MCNYEINNCFPNNNGEEFYVNNFLDLYNSQLNEEFTILYSPEEKIRNSPQPEFILSNRKQLVAIERKIFCFPKNIIHRHSLFHELANRVHSRLSNKFQDNLYRLEIDCMEIPNSLREVKNLCDEMIRTIEKERKFLNEGLMIVPLNKPHWEFKIVPQFERNEWDPDKGIAVSESNIHKYYQFDFDRKELVKTLWKLLFRVSKKFKDYPKSIFLMHLHWSDKKETILNEIQNLKRYFPNINELWISEIIDPEFESPFFEYTKIHS